MAIKNNNARTMNTSDYLKDAFYAARTGDLKTIELALSQGLDINATDQSGMTMLHYAAGGNHAGLVAELISRGIDPTKEDKFGRRASTVWLEVQGMLTLREWSDERATVLLDYLRPLCYPNVHTLSNE